MSTQIYREVGNADDALLKWLEDREQLFPIQDPKGNEHLFIDNDQPRDRDITPMIITATTSFALFADNDNGENQWVGSYRSLDKAIAAQQNAKVVVTTEVDPGEDTQPEWSSDAVAADFDESA